jgi:hypothetical protein
MISIVHPPTSWSSQWPLFFWVSHKYTICIPILPHSCYMPCPSHPPWLDHSNYTWRRVQPMKLLIMQFSPLSCHFITEWATKTNYLVYSYCICMFHIYKKTFQQLQWLKNPLFLCYSCILKESWTLQPNSCVHTGYYSFNNASSFVTHQQQLFI